MVPAGSRRITRVPRYSGVRYGSPRFAYGIVTLCDVPFQTLPLALAVRHRGPTTPPMRCHMAGLGSSPFARHYWGNHVCFLFLRVLRCFSSPRWPPNLIGCHPFRMTGCPMRKSPDHRSLAPTRRLSQLITSFFAAESQGIRRAPFDTFSQRSRIAAATAHTFSCILCPCCLLSSGRNRILSLRFTVLLVSICQRSFER